MSRALFARLGAARLALQDREGKILDSLSLVQKNAVLDIARREKDSLSALPPEALARVVDLATSVPWAQGHLEEVLDNLVRKDAPSPRRREMQRFMPALLNYFKQTEWQAMMESSNAISRVDFLLTRAHQLSGRNLSEHCMKFMAALVMHLAGNADMSSMQIKRATVDHLKVEFKRRCRKMPAPTDYVLELPSDPFELQAAHPSLFNAIYMEEKPVPNKLDMAKVLAANSMIPCRSTSRLNFDLTPYAATPEVFRPIDAGANMLMQQMITLQQENLAMLKFNANTPVRGLAALTGQPSTPIAALVPQGSAPAALTHLPREAILESQSTSSQDVAADELARLPPPAEVGESAARTALVAKPSARAVQILDDFVEMCDAKAADKKKHKKAESVGGSAAAHDDVVGPAEETAAEKVSACRHQASARRRQGPAAKALPTAKDARASTASSKKVSKKSGGAASSKAASKKAGVSNGSKAKATDKATPRDQKSMSLPQGERRIRLDHEASRSQYLVRVGFGKGSSFRFVYDATDEESKKQALDRARNHLERARAELE